MREDTDLAESFEGEEWVAVSFPLSGSWQSSVFNIFLAWKDCASEWTGACWTILLIGGGVGRDKLG
jgi:hypothetical protein